LNTFNYNFIIQNEILYTNANNQQCNAGIPFIKKNHADAHYKPLYTGNGSKTKTSTALKVLYKK